ncbi:hypothetical protein M9978_12755 [Sphingomonas sp. MG17]|uniref:DUF5983 domain-containing protein n=1 Tax=Sphingomonas tagetis TaxID=2949092 RepID=A0A9X2HPS7_9SPHN|nr:hypothetical protein [Sphingomonas tagetis]MCP3731298.1 hypothetical protein [Sphingomonas tagetis]
MPIGKFVVIGTMHVRCATAQRLSDWALLTAADQPLAVSATPGGWFLPTHEVECGADVPPELHAILAFGRKHGCGYVLLDCDGPECAALPVFPW